MSFGYDRQPRIFVADSAPLVAYLYDRENEDLVPRADLVEALFTVIRPGDDPTAPIVQAQPGQITGDGTAEYIVPDALNSVAGHYIGRAQFTVVSGTGNIKRSVPVEYDVVDPFSTPGPQPGDPAVDMAWKKLEDCFDSELGGPWLRDMTLARFDRNKVAELAPEVMLEINSVMPQSSYNMTSFPWNDRDGTALFAQGLLVATIRHLMRSYTEQPTVMNSTVGYFNREKYQQAWSVMYQIELDRFEKWVQLWKAREYNLSSGSLLVGSKAGRMLPAPMRTRSVGRGYY